jgi:hypothetical protein
MPMAMPADADVVKQKTTTTGTGAYTLDVSIDGFQDFEEILADGSIVPYFVRLGANFEAGVGTYSAGTLARTLVTASSNGGAAVDWPAGQKLIYISATAHFLAALAKTADLAAYALGPASSVDNTLPRFDGTGGKTLQGSGVVVDDSNNVTGIAGLNIGGGTLGSNLLKVHGSVFDFYVNSNGVVYGSAFFTPSDNVQFNENGLSCSQSAVSAGLLFRRTTCAANDARVFSPSASVVKIDNAAGGAAGLELTGALLAADGSQAAPSLSFASNSSHGFFDRSTGIGVTVGGSNYWAFEPAILRMRAGVSLQWGSDPFGLTTGPDLGFERSAAGVGEINNGTLGTFRDLKLRDLIASGALIGPAAGVQQFIHAGGSSKGFKFTRASDGGDVFTYNGVDSFSFNGYVSSQLQFFAPKIHVGAGVGSDPVFIRDAAGVAGLWRDDLSSRASLACLDVTASGVASAPQVNTTNNAGAQFGLYDRTTNRFWVMYSTGDVYSLFNGTGNVFSVSSAGDASISGSLSVPLGTVTTPGVQVTGSIGSGLTDIHQAFRPDLDAIIVHGNHVFKWYYATSGNVFSTTAIAGIGQVSGTVEANDGTLGSYVPFRCGMFRPGSYTVATLPTPTAAGQLAYASDGRNTLELAAAGTGTMVRSTGAAGSWKTLYDNTTVAA